MHENEPVVVPTRGIQPSQIDPDALKVVRRLRQFGHVAYLVGGCVRDLLLRRAPKDFDVATSAKPNEIRKVFRNCRLIGRRFRLAHIFFQKKIIETATFRAGNPEGENGNGGPGPSSEGEGDLLIRSDNVFGTEGQDARRRDFTINALFYDPFERTLVDYVGGLEDLVDRTIRFIGSPDVRVQEDPVRILRAIKFAARLGFQIEPEAQHAIKRHCDQLSRSAPPRVLEEILRMLGGGASEASFRLLWETGVLSVILPEVARYLVQAPDRREERDPGCGLFAYLRTLDRCEPGSLSRAVMLGSVLLHPIADASARGCAAYGVKVSSSAPGEVARQILRQMVERLHLPRWEAELVQQMVANQKRLFQLSVNSPLPRSLIERTTFPEVFALFEIGVRSTGKGRRLCERLRQAVLRGGEPSAPAPRTPPATRKRARRRRPRRRTAASKATG